MLLPKSISQMIGKSFMYKTLTYAIQDIECVEDDLYAVTTDKRTIRVTSAELRNDLLPINEMTKGKNGKHVQSMINALPEEKVFTDLVQTLQDNIKKIQNDPKYIPQASAINDQAKSIIDAKKLQLDVVKTARDLMR